MPDGRERRIEPRLDILLPVDYYLDRRRVRKFHVASNISSGGAFINTTDPLKIGEEMDVILSLFDEARPDSAPRRFFVHGTVRHIRPPDGSLRSDPRAGMGIEWVDMDSQTWNELRRAAEGPPRETRAAS
ncbi:MAG: PilZ domain-containing protein [Deltaproteobacteria bacterium]|nr:PilZ domain-containing protein [Deltaproteobacteria bacterium]